MEGATGTIVAERCLRVREVADMFGVSTREIWRWSQEPDFPQPVKPIPDARVTRWVLSEIMAFMEDCKAKRKVNTGT